MAGDSGSGNKKVMNRWIIVFGCIMIQLALGAIYAWSAFTGPLGAPAPDTTFQNHDTDNGITIVAEFGKFTVGKENTMTFHFTENNATASGFTDVAAKMDVRDKTNAVTAAGKAKAVTEAGGNYSYTIKISKAGNLHFVVTANRTVANATVNYAFDIMKNVGTGEYGFTKTETQAIFSAGLATFAVFVIIGGRLQNRFGPKIVALTGGLILGMGYTAASFVGASFILKLATIGIIAGAGIGLAYVVPIAVGVKWFPDRKGLVTGLAVAGFGFGSFIWILAANPPTVLGFAGLITKQAAPYFYTVANVDHCFLIYGLIFMAMVVVGALIIRNPPAGWKPEGWNPPEAASGKPSDCECSSGDMLRTPQFYILWVMFIVGALAGLMVIGNVQVFGQSDTDGFTAHGFTIDDAMNFAIIGAAVCLPILNGTGRIVWGQIADKIGCKKAMVCMFILQGIMMSLFFFTTANPFAFFVVAAFIGFNFGGNFALFPTSCATSFGAKSVGINYGFLFTAYGIGGIVGPLLAGAVVDAKLSFMYAFVPAAVMCFIAACLALAYNPVVEKKEQGGDKEKEPAPTKEEPAEEEGDSDAEGDAGKEPGTEEPEEKK